MNTTAALVESALTAMRNGDMLPTLVLADRLAEIGETGLEAELRRYVEKYFQLPKGILKRVCCMAIDSVLNRVKEKFQNSA